MIGCTEKTFTTETQSTRRKKNADLERNFSASYHCFLRFLRVLYTCILKESTLTRKE